MSSILQSTRVLGGAELGAVLQRWLDDLVRRDVLGTVAAPVPTDPGLATLAPPAGGSPS